MNRASRYGGQFTDGELVAVLGLMPNTAWLRSRNSLVQAVAGR